MAILARKLLLYFHTTMHLHRRKIAQRLLASIMVMAFFFVSSTLLAEGDDLGVDEDTTAEEVIETEPAVGSAVTGTGGQGGQGSQSSVPSSGTSQGSSSTPPSLNQLANDLNGKQGSALHNDRRQQHTNQVQEIISLENQLTDALKEKNMSPAEMLLLSQMLGRMVDTSIGITPRRGKNPYYQGTPTSTAQKAHLGVPSVKVSTQKPKLVPKGFQLTGREKVRTASGEEFDVVIMEDSAVGSSVGLTVDETTDSEGVNLNINNAYAGVSDFSRQEAEAGGSELSVKTEVALGRELESQENPENTHQASSEEASKAADEKIQKILDQMMNSVQGDTASDKSAKSATATASTSALNPPGSIEDQLMQIRARKLGKKSKKLKSGQKQENTVSQNKEEVVEPVRELASHEEESDALHASTTSLKGLPTVTPKTQKIPSPLVYLLLIALAGVFTSLFYFAMRKKEPTEELNQTVWSPKKSPGQKWQAHPKGFVNPRPITADLYRAAAVAKSSNLPKVRYVPGSLYIKYDSDQGRYLIIRSNFVGNLEKVVGVVRPGSVINAESLGMGEKSKRFILTDEGRWQDTNKEETAVIEMFPQP